MQPHADGAIERPPSAAFKVAPAAADHVRRVATRKPTARKPVKRKKPKVVCRKVRVAGSRRTKKVCKPVKKKKRVVKQPVRRRPATPAPVTRPTVPVGGGTVPAPSPAAPPVTTPPAPLPPPPVVAPTAPGVPVYAGPFGVVQAQRLLWRAGFGPRPGEAEALAGMGLIAAVRSLTRPVGEPLLTGAEPTAGGQPIAPFDVWSHDHVWWLDRMVRSSQPLVERMTLIWHDWLAVSNGDVNDRRMMIAQNELFRRHALGSFRDLILDVTVDPAMLLFLSGIDNRRGAPNENYARELMELFTLGADRGAYTEDDVRDLARALTGWRATWSDELGFHSFRFDPNRHDTGIKRLWAGTAHERSGTFGWQDACQLCLDNPWHRSFLVLKLWSYFVPSPPSAATQAALEQLYVAGGRTIGPVVEAILLHPDLYEGAPLVKPPIVFNAGLLRIAGQTITEDAWGWRGDQAGQMLFYPPNVAGWNDRAWLDTSRLYGRWHIASAVLRPLARTGSSYAGSTETAAEALAAALELLGRPALTAETHGSLLAFAEQAAPAGFSAQEYRAHRQNALRMLIATAPDCQVC